MEVFTAASLAALVWKFISVFKDLTGGRPRGAMTQAITWLAGIAAVALAAQADVAENMVVFGTMRLGELDAYSLILAGIALGSTASVSYDIKKAVDQTDSAVEPRLGG